MDASVDTALNSWNETWVEEEAVAVAVESKVMNGGGGGNDAVGLERNRPCCCLDTD